MSHSSTQSWWGVALDPTLLGHIAVMVVIVTELFWWGWGGVGAGGLGGGGGGADPP